jgi:hypothetical protein
MDRDDRELEEGNPMIDIPNPGSRKAIKAGCKCPVLDNGHGWGYIVQGQYVMMEDCPLHRWTKKP